QNVPFPMKLAVRGEIAEQAVRIGLESLRSTKLEVVRDVKRAYFAYYLMAVSLDVTRASLDLLERARNSAQARFESGLAPQEDVLRAEVELRRLANDVLTLEAEVTTAKSLLNVLMNRAIEADVPP